ncbi:hypothetical protein TWF694_007380 [Orbilia ellipsospora]|uniref:Spindle pole body-associated protein cut12 domain-containing protein n=1 Tax=Orbilia ellipsospora TaxID=2528407 RepID=A0AAV9XHM8_9PEZI
MPQDTAGRFFGYIGSGNEAENGYSYNYNHNTSVYSSYGGASWSSNYQSSSSWCGVNYYGSGYQNNNNYEQRDSSGISLQLDISAFLEVLWPELMAPQQQHQQPQQQHCDPQPRESKQQHEKSKQSASPCEPVAAAHLPDIPHQYHPLPSSTTTTILSSPYDSESPAESSTSQSASPPLTSSPPSEYQKIDNYYLEEEDLVFGDESPLRENFLTDNAPRKRDTFINMLAWLRGDQQPGEEEEVDQDLIIPDHEQPEEPETPGPAAFAFTAFRTGLFGTPKPDLEVREHERRPRYGREVLSDEDVFTSSRKRPESRSPGRFKTFEDVMTPPRRNPQSILVTPGNTIAKKKTVSFGPDQFHEDTISYEARTGRVRSGLPAQYPGKFPSPWTPKITNDFPKRKGKDSRAEDIEIFEDQNKPLRPIQKSKLKGEKEPLTAFKSRDDPKSVDDQIQALRENTARINDMIEEASEGNPHEGDVTVNLDEPRSRSGVYWKERYSSDLGQAEKKVEFYKARKDTSVEFASRKDEQAAHLATRLKEEMELRRKMQAEIDKWQKLAMEARPDPSTTVNAPLTETYQQKTIERLRRETSEYREIIRQKEVEMNDHEYQLDRQRSEIDRQARRIKELETALKAKKEAADEVSIYNTNAESEIRTLKRELRKAESAAAGKDLINAKYESAQREIERLRQQVSLVKEENIRLKIQQKSNNSLGDMDEAPAMPPTDSRPKAQSLKSNQAQEEDIWQSLSTTNAPKDKPRNRSPKITEHSAFPSLNLVDSSLELGGIFSKNPALSLPQAIDKIPTIDEYLKQEDSDSTLAGNPMPSPIIKPLTLMMEPTTKATPNSRKPVSTTVMSEKEIMQQLEHTDISLPPISPTVASMSDTDLDKLKIFAKPLPRMSKEDLAKSFDIGAAKPKEPLKLDGLKTCPLPEIGKKYETDEEKFTLRRSTTSPMPKYFNFEKAPNSRRGSFASMRSFVSSKSQKAGIDISDAISLKTSAAVAAPVVATGVGITTKTSPGSDTDAKRKLAAAKMAEMKARMKAAKKEGKA